MTAPNRRSYQVIGLPPRSRQHDDELGRYSRPDDIADGALAVADAVRDHDPARIEAELLQLCWRAPGAAVQLLMALAMMLPIETMDDEAFEDQVVYVATGGKTPAGGAA